MMLAETRAGRSRMLRVRLGRRPVTRFVGTAHWSAAATTTADIGRETLVVLQVSALQVRSDPPTLPLGVQDVAMFNRLIAAVGLDGAALSEQARLQVRLLVMASLLAAGGFAAFAAKQLSGGIALLGWLDLTAFNIIIANLVALRSHGHWRISVQILMGSVFLGLTGLTFASGGVGLPAPFLLCVVPLGATGLSGSRKAGLGWGLASLAVLAATGSLHAGGYAFPAAVTDPRAQVGLMLAAAGLSVTITSVLVVSGAYLQDTTLRALARMNQDLARAKDEARTASRAKTDFLANMSHEIRTPMNGILGGLQLLEQVEGVPEEGRELTDTALTSARTLLALLDDIIDLAKAESGKMVFESVPFDLARTVREVVELFETAARAKGLEVRAEYMPGSPEWIVGDPVKVRQVLCNLLGNATKFTHSGHVRVVVHGGQPDLRLEVHDTGIGITPEHRERIFDTFVQADASTNRLFGGTGLGLAVSRRLAEGMGGELSVRSVEGEGSTFTLHLPFVAAEAGPTPSPRAEIRAPAAGETVLLVEDNRVNRLIATRILERIGYQVQECEDGQAALEAVAGQRFEAILMDCHMPGMDGYEATRRLRAQGVQTPIIALTASAMQSDRARCLEAGMDDFLAKPIETEALAETLCRRIGAAQKS